MDKLKKIRYGKCEACYSRIDMKALFTVRDKKLCAHCGQKEISRWNENVREWNDSVDARRAAINSSPQPKPETVSPSPASLQEGSVST